jgi:hypothetical protein
LTLHLTPKSIVNTGAVEMVFKNVDENIAINPRHIRAIKKVNAFGKRGGCSSFGSISYPRQM